MQLGTTFFEGLHVLEFLQDISKVVVCDKDLVISTLGILHPCSLLFAIFFVGHGIGDGGQGVLALPC